MFCGAYGAGGKAEARTAQLEATRDAQLAAARLRSLTY